jgi:alpha-amylase
MCTKWFADGDVHKYFNPFETPYDCFINFMNILQDLNFRIKGKRQGLLAQLGKALAIGGE